MNDQINYADLSRAKDLATQLGTLAGQNSPPLPAATTNLATLLDRIRRQRHLRDVDHKLRATHLIMAD